MNTFTSSSVLRTTAVLSLSALVLAGCGSGGSDAPREAASVDEVATLLEDAGLDQVASSMEQAGEFADTLEDGTPFQIADRIKDRVENGDEIRYVFSYQSTSVPLLSAQLKSGYDASLPLADRLLPMTGKALAPSAAADIPAQASQIEALLNTDQIDCLTIQQPDLNAMNQVRDRALEAGIPVFMVNVESNGHEVAQFRQDRTKEGVAAAQTLIDWVDAGNPQPTTIGLTSGDPSATWSKGRLNGFVDTIEAAWPDVTFVNTPEAPLKTPFDPAQAYDAYKAFLTGNGDVDFILNADLSIEQAARAISDLDRTGDVHTMGWNVSAGQLDAIEEGTQVATLDQGWSQHGAYGAIACAMLLGENEVMPNTQEPGVITQDNLAEAREAFENATADQ